MMRNLLCHRRKVETTLRPFSINRNAFERHLSLCTMRACDPQLPKHAFPRAEAFTLPDASCNSAGHVEGTRCGDKSALPARAFCAWGAGRGVKALRGSFSEDAVTSLDGAYRLIASNGKKSA